MLDRLAMPIVAEIVVLIELIGVAIITVGAAYSLVRFLPSLVRRSSDPEAVAQLRSSLGRSILIGLEFLVAADIINTVVIDLSIENVISLVAIVAIRVVLSFSLEAEIEGRWPWQRASAKRST
jgi:uncharacterized membrane protein